MAPDGPGACRTNREALPGRDQQSKERGDTVAKGNAIAKQPDAPGGRTGLQEIKGNAVRPAEFDRLIHERIRLGIVSALAVNDTLTFGDLKALLKTTDGNISVHARKLEDAAYIACTKSFEGRIPKTKYRLTAEGRSALERYLKHMEALIRVTRER